MKQTTIFTVLVVSIFMGVVSWMRSEEGKDIAAAEASTNTESQTDARSETIKPEDEMSNLENLVNDLHRYTGFDFGAVEPSLFNWQVAGSEIGPAGQEDTVPVNGISASASFVPNLEAIKIGKFFAMNGFEADPFNVSAGTTIWSSGYRKDNMVCLVREQISGCEEGLQSDLVTNDVKVLCGEL